MTMRFAGAAALGVGVLLAFGVAATHPTGHEGGDPHALALLSGAVHAIAVFGQALLSFGALAMTRTVWREDHAGAWFAFILFAFGSVAAISAAMMSGFITPLYTTAPAGASAALLDVLHELARLSMRINQAFGFTHQFFVAGAVLVWSLCWPRGGAGAAALQIGGIVAGLGSLALLSWLLYGGHRLNPHMFAVVTIAQALWLLGAAAALATRRD
jgi:hypothetical protein